VVIFASGICGECCSGLSHLLLLCGFFWSSTSVKFYLLNSLNGFANLLMPPAAAKVSSSGDCVSLIVGLNFFSAEDYYMCGILVENSLLIFHSSLEQVLVSCLEQARGSSFDKKEYGSSYLCLNRFKFNGFAGIPFVLYLSSRSQEPVSPTWIGLHNPGAC
jgi:hypothetical protein